MSIRARTKKSRIPKSIIDEMQNYAEKEAKFSLHLKNFIITKLDNPLLIFMSKYKAERLFLKFKGPKDEVRRSYLIINELQKLFTDEKLEDKERHIGYILDMIKYKNVRPHLIKLISNRKKLVNLMKKNKFIPPKVDLLMQKKGKLMNKTVLRKCYMTRNAFGQLKKNKKDELLKPLFFRDQYVILETKNRVLEQIANIKKLNKKKLGIKKILKWPDKKELVNYQCRLRFENIMDFKQTAIYFPEAKDCEVIKYHVVTERILSSDPNLGKKIKVLPSIWKVAQYEYFYNNFIKKFFKTTDIYQKITKYNDDIGEVVKNFVDEKYPNLEESLLEEDKNVFEFNNNVHATLLKKRDVIDVEDGLGDKLMASVIVRDYDNLKTPHKQINKFKSDFEVVKQRTLYKKPMLKLIAFEEKKKYLPKKFIERVFFKHKMLFTIKKIMLENIEQDENLGKNEVDIGILKKMNLEVQIIPVEGGEIKTSPTIKGEENLEYITYQTEISLIISFKRIDELKIIIVDKNTGKVLVEFLPDLRNLLEIIILEQYFVIPFIGKINESVIKGNIFVSLVIFPKNLEMAHLSYSKTEIEWNFENFGDLLELTTNYSLFKNDFFPEDYLENQNYDAFNGNCHFYNQKHIGITNFNSFFNENKFIHSFLEIQNDFDIIKHLQKIRELEDRDINYIFETTVTNYNRSEKRNMNLIYEIFLKIINLLDTKNRALLHSLNFQIFSSDFTKLTFNQIKGKFQNTLMFQLDQKIISFIEKHSYLTNHQKFRLFKITFEIVLLFNNNFIKGANLKIAFSNHYLIIILKILLINYNLSDEYIRKIIINIIFRNNWMNNYTQFSSLVLINNKLIIFKHFFKALYFDFYDTYFGKRIDFDDILSRLLSNSFCNILSAEDFNIYLDFKIFFETVLSFDNFKLEVITNFADLEITIFGLFDILLLLQIFKDNYLKVKNLKQNNVMKFVQEIIKTDCSNIKNILPNIMRLFETLYNENFFMEEIKYLISLQKTNIYEEGLKSEQLKNKILSLNLDQSKFQELINKKFLRNETFKFKAKAIYHIISNDDEIPIENLKVSIFDKNILDFQTKKNHEEILLRDAFFEVLDVFEESTYENPKEFENKKKSKNRENKNTLLIHINNLDYKMINSINIKQNREDFNQIEIDRDEFNSIIKFFSAEINFSKITEIWDLLTFLYNNETEVSLLFIITIFICFSQPDFSECYDNIIYLLKNITQIFFPGENEKILPEGATCVFNVLKKFYPTTSIEESVSNLFDNIEGNNYFHVKDAKIYFYDFEIDVNYLVKKHFSSFLFKTGKYGIHFSSSFCKDLVVVFKNLEKTKDFYKRDQKFSLLLSISQLEIEKTYSIEFKISFSNDETHIFSKLTTPLYFERKISKEKLIFPNVIKYFVFNSPLNYYLKNDFPETSFIFRKVPLIFNLEYKKKIFLQTKINFDFDKEIEMVNSLTSWSYSKEAKIQDILLELEEKKLNFQIPFSFFFMKLVYLVKYILNLIIQKLSEESILKFVKLNTDDYDLVTGSKKKVDFESFLYDLKEFEDLSKKNKSFTLVIQYKF